MYLQKCQWKTIACIIILCSSFMAQAQIDELNNTMAWTSLSVSKKFNKQWSASYSQLHSVALDEMEFNFIQSNLKMTRRLKKYTYISAGYKPTFKLNASNDEEQIVFHRLYAEARYTQKYRKFRFQHKLGGEHHFTPVAKFQQRYYYSLKTYYRNKKWPMELRPYFTQKLFYYAGGDPIPVDEDLDENELIDIAPNGLHAYRYQIGVRISPTDRLNVSTFYMRQIEFNTPFLGNEINVMNIETGKIAAPFYNFGVIGVSMSYRL